MIVPPVLAVVALFSAACSSSAQPARQPGPNDVVATVGTTSITMAQVDEVALQQASSAFGSLTLQQALYEARRAALDDMIGSLLVDQEAKTLGVDRAALVEREITAKVQKPTEAEVVAWFQTNAGRVQGAELDKVRQPIAALLLEERTRTARQGYLGTLRAKIPVTVSLDPPRVQVDAAGRPARGPADAPIEIIEFSDFECPFCLRAYPTVMQVLSTYGDKVRLVYRHFPLDNHPNAKPAAEASACAAEQGKFWEYHDRLFGGPGRLSGPDLKQHAATLGLDTARFNACVDQRTYRTQVQEDVETGERVGVTGTPAFFINGRPLSGAQPFEVFKRIIDEELR